MGMMNFVLSSCTIDILNGEKYFSNLKKLLQRQYEVSEKNISHLCLRFKSDYFELWGRDSSFPSMKCVKIIHGNIGFYWNYSWSHFTNVYNNTKHCNLKCASSKVACSQLLIYHQGRNTISLVLVVSPLCVSHFKLWIVPSRC